MAGRSGTPRVRFRMVASALGAVLALVPALVVGSPAGAAAATASCTDTSFIAPGPTATTGTIASAGQVDCYQIFAKIGQTLRVRVVGTSGALVPSTEVDGPKGGVICGPATTTDQNCKPTVRGLQTIAIRDSSATSTGGYSVVVQYVHNPVGCGALGFGPPPNTGTLAPGDLACFTFKAPGGSFFLTRSVGTSGTVVPRLEELNADGVTKCGPDTSFQQDCRLLSRGNQTLFVEDAAGPNRGTFSVYAQLTKPVGCSSIKFGKAVQSSIASAGQTDCYKFAGVHGHRMRVTVAATSGDLVTDTEVEKPNGTTFCETSTIAEQDCRLTTDGSHTVFVSDVTGHHTGNYTIYVQDLAAPLNCTTIQYGKHADQHPASIAFPGAENCYQFAGTPGTGAHLTVKATGGSLSPIFDIYTVSGADFPSGYCDHSATDERCMLGVAGNYTILVRDATAKNTGPYYYTLTERVFTS